MMDDIRVPIYLVTGFLESGKTTFLDFTLQQEYFAIDGKTLLILCEEGEEEYDMDKLKLTNTVVEVIEDEEDLADLEQAIGEIESGCHGYHPSAGACCDRVQRNVACK